MLSDKISIQQLASLMLAHNISDVVLCPGSRNAPLCHTFSQLPDFHCHALTDERSAGFFAIGLALATSRPVAVCVTSGSALVNLHPAVVEAYYQQVPLVVISADRPAAWIGQMDGQTMPQPDVFGALAKRSVNLPEVDSLESVEAWHANRLINEALLECTHCTFGPVHINVPLSEPFYTFTTEKLPEQRVIRRIEGLYPSQLRELAELLRQSHRRMIIIGQKPADRQVRPAFMDELGRGFVSLCEHLANPGVGSIALDITDRLMDEAEAEAENFRPDLVITICGHIVSKKLKQFLRKHPPRQHWHVSPDGSVADLFGCLTTVIEAHPYPFLEALAYMMIPIEEENDFPDIWRHKALCIEQERIVPSVDEAAVSIAELMACLPDNAVLHLANSSSVRLAQRFRLSPGVTVCCNRGVNGIEGSVSAAVGYATATPDRPNFVIIGDLSFFYDQNGLWNESLPNNLHILLLNSGGGKIFDTLPVPDDAKSRDIICARHKKTAESVAQQYGLLYLNGREKMQDFLDSEQSVLWEVKV